MVKLIIGFIGDKKYYSSYFDTLSIININIFETTDAFATSGCTYTGAVYKIE